MEVQIRTQLQHYWATAVEAAGEIYGTEYKSPEVRRQAVGPEDQERIQFFQIVSSLFALEEGAPQVPGFERSQNGIGKTSFRRLNAHHAYWMIWQRPQTASSFESSNG